MLDYKIVGPCIYLEKEKILIVGDMHCGFEEETRRSLGHVYLGQKKESLKLLKKVLSKIKGKPKEIIFLGDITHSFLYKKSEIENFKEILSFLKKIKISIVRGNHDLFLKREMFGKNVSLKDFILRKKILFIHGDKKSFKKLNNKTLNKAKFIFLGHFHPAIEIKEDIKKERYKCFLIGKYKGKEYFFLPSFFSLIEGRDIRKNEEINKELVNNLKVFVIDEKFNVYDFGKLANLKF